MLAIAVTVAGCGGESPAEAWAGDFCSSVDRWTDELSAASETFRNPQSLTVDAARAAIGDSVAATETLADELTELGAPPTEGGDEIRADLNALGEQLRQDVRDLSDPPGSSGEGAVASLAEQIVAVVAVVGRMTSAVSETVEALADRQPASELARAFESSDECQSIGASR